MKEQPKTDYKPLIRGSWCVAQQPSCTSAIIPGRLVLTNLDSPLNRQDSDLTNEEEVKAYLEKNKASLELKPIGNVRYIRNYKQFKLDEWDGLRLGADSSVREIYWIAPKIASELLKAPENTPLNLPGYLFLMRYRDCSGRGTNPIYHTSFIAKDDEDLDLFEQQRGMDWCSMGVNAFQRKAMELERLMLDPSIVFTEELIRRYKKDE